MKKNYVYHINHENVSVYEFLYFQNYPKSIITFLKHHNDCILVNGKPTTTNYLLQKDETLIISIIDEENNKTIPTKLDFEIVYEDDSLMVINKPIHMPVHTCKDNMTTTLQNGVKYLYPQLTYHCLTRLDTDTTGLLVLAKDKLIASLLAKQHIEKEYLALVTGNPGNGIVDKPIAKNGMEIKRIIDENGKYAITHYETLKTLDDYSLIKLKLETGRTHQIRLHMSSIGYPLLGDPLYNPNPESFSRCALHVSYMKFIHPLTSENLEFNCPLPIDMARMIK